MCNATKIVKEEVSMEQHKIYNVLDVARYVVWYCIHKDNPISQIQLQKIMYYIQANFLVYKKGVACFKEPILNWTYGPVVREVYDEFRYFGSNKITFVPKIQDIQLDDEFNFVYKSVEFNPSVITLSDRHLIEHVVNKYCEENAFTLVEKTHSEGPWLETNRNDEITKEVILKYYTKYPSKL